MSRGPLPDPKKRRRNAPTIPTTDLPATGREGDPPEIPEAYNLGLAGMEWWNWAWALPQACAWDDGALYTAARRAALEDELSALDRVDNEFAVEELLSELAGADDDTNEFAKIGRSIDFLLGRLKKNATGSVALMKEMRELDNKLGLNPKALSDLRWKIVDKDGAAEPQKAPPAVKDNDERRARLSAVG